MDHLGTSSARHRLGSSKGSLPPIHLQQMLPTATVKQLCSSLGYAFQVQVYLANALKSSRSLTSLLELLWNWPPVLQRSATRLARQRSAQTAVST
eukprot:3878770-Amphidinium_carterae.1